MGVTAGPDVRHGVGGRLVRGPVADWVGLAARLLLCIVLIAAGGLKVGKPIVSARAVQAYQIFPFEIAGYIGYALPVLEIAVGLLLVVGLFTRPAAIIGAGLMIAFILGIASAWARGLSIDCGCFGGGGEIEREKAIAAYPWEIARDIGLAAAGLWLFFRPRTPFSLDGFLFPPLNETGAGGVQDVEDPQDAPTASPTI